MKNEQIVDSYKNNFKSPIGAYVYMLLNQNAPELFTLSSNRNNDLGNQLENILVNAQDFNSIITDLNSAPKESFDIVSQESLENDLSKPTILKLVNNIKYVQIDWNAPNAWSELSGLIEYNQFSQFIPDKLPLQQKLQEYAEKFSLASLSLNPNCYPHEFLDKFDMALIQCVKF